MKRFLSSTLKNYSNNFQINLEQFASNFTFVLLLTLLNVYCDFKSDEGCLKGHFKL